MAGFTDAPFRKLCRDYGSAWAVTEMVSAKGMLNGDRKGIEIGEPYFAEPDLVIQVFGGEADIVAAGGRKIFDTYAPQALDLNMGCPVKKITGKSCGSKLMLEPERAAAIVRALNEAVPVPVSAKMRLGYDQENVIEVAQAVAEAGAAMVAVHGRTAAQKYTGEANWEAIAQVAEHVSIPVIGSGDVTSREQFERYRALNLGVMIARGAVGQPWIFADLKGSASPAAQDRAKTAYKHLLLHLNWYGSDSLEREKYLVLKFRGQLIKYFAFLEGARETIIKLESLEDVQSFVLEWLALDLSDLKTNALKRERVGKKKHHLVSINS